MKRATLISSGTLSRIFHEVNDAWQRLDFQTAIQEMERAHRLDTANTEILLALGRMYGRRYNYDAAEQCFEKALRLTVKKTEMLAAIGRICHEFGNFNLASRYLKLATDKADAPVKTLIKLAEIYQRLRFPDRAGEMIKRVLHVDPGNADALLLQARLERQAGHLETAEHLLRIFPSKSDPVCRANAMYELCGILDRQGRFDEAMNALLEAKGLLLPKAAPHRAALKIVRERIRIMKAALSKETLQRWFHASPKLEPPRRLALLGGHPRSGTTLLEQVLDSHSSVCSLEETELFHLEAYLPLTKGLPPDAPMMNVLDNAPLETLQKSRDRYFDAAIKYLGSDIQNNLLLDKNPSLTFLIPALLRIFPEIKLLIILRDPRDVILSCFMQPIQLSQVSSAYLAIDTAIDEYSAMMNLWLTIKPMIQDHYLEVRYEEMVADLESVARQSLAFLGMPWDAQVLGFDAHARKKLVRSPTYADVTQPVYQRAKGRWRNYQNYLEPHLAQLEPFVKAFGYE